MSAASDGGSHSCRRSKRRREQSNWFAPAAGGTLDGGEPLGGVREGPEDEDGDDVAVGGEDEVAEASL